MKNCMLYCVNYVKNGELHKYQANFLPTTTMCTWEAASLPYG